MSLTLYFLRHGETTYSKTGAYCGEVDAELTPDGVRMDESIKPSRNQSCLKLGQPRYRLKALRAPAGLPYEIAPSG